MTILVVVHLCDRQPRGLLDFLQEDSRLNLGCNKDVSEMHERRGNYVNGYPLFVLEALHLGFMTSLKMSQLAKEIHSRPSSNLMENS